MVHGRRRCAEGGKGSGGNPRHHGRDICGSRRRPEAEGLPAAPWGDAEFACPGEAREAHWRGGMAHHISGERRTGDASRRTIHHRGGPPWLTCRPVSTPWNSRCAPSRAAHEAATRPKPAKPPAKRPRDPFEEEDG